MRYLLILLLMAAPAAWATTNPKAALGVGYDPKPGAALPTDAGLRDEAGAAFTIGQVEHGPPILLALVYYRCPNLCGIVLDDLFGALRRAGLVPGRDYRLVAVSIDPNEGPADAARVKARHLADFGTETAAANWHFLTGTPAALAAWRDAVGYRAADDAALRQFIHPTGIVVVTPQGRIARYLLGVGYRPNDVRLALAEARTGTIAALSRPVLLICWHYDPVTGRYSLALMNILRLAALLTAATVGGTVYLALRREGRAS